MTMAVRIEKLPKNDKHFKEQDAEVMTIAIVAALFFDGNFESAFATAPEEFKAKVTIMANSLAK